MKLISENWREILVNDVLTVGAFLLTSLIHGYCIVLVWEVCWEAVLEHPRRDGLLVFAMLMTLVVARLTLPLLLRTPKYTKQDLPKWFFDLVALPVVLMAMIVIADFVGVVNL